jgi:hypothetical protein
MAVSWMEDAFIDLEWRPLFGQWTAKILKPFHEKEKK